MKSNKLLLSVAIGALVLVGLVGLMSITAPKALTLGNADIGDYKVKTTGVDQVVSYGPAILRNIIFTKANDQVLIGDVKYGVASTSSAASNSVFKITASVPMVYPVNTTFLNGIIANVTATDGVVFTITPTY